MNDLDKIKQNIVNNKWAVRTVPDQFKNSILNWLKQSCDEIVKTGWAPHPNIEVSIKQLSAK